MLTLPLTLLLALPAPAAPAAQPQEPVPAARREAIRERGQALVDALVARGLPGASAALVLPDGSTVAVVAGVASVEGRRPLEPADRMLSGSVGKTYVTAAAHHLVSRGRLDLDERAAAYFEGEGAEWLERLPNARAVTLRQLLGHRSGLPRYVFEPAFAKDLTSDPDRHWTPEQLLGYVFDHEPLFAPGERFSYSDTNYIVVGMVIEEVSGESFYDYVREHLLAPHGLEDTIPSNGRRLARVVQGHVVLGRQLGVPERTLGEDGAFVFNPQFEWCGGGWACTPTDLARWTRVLYSGAAFEAPYLDTLLDAAPAPELGPGTRYGLGAMLRDGPAGEGVGHDGFMPGYLTSTAWFPEHGVAVTIQLNTDDMRAVGAPLAAKVAELAAAAGEALAD